MKIFSADQIRKADAYTIAHEPIASHDLMERASEAFCNWLSENLSDTKHFTIFCGLGNNGGDGLAIARLLKNSGKTVSVFVIAYADKKSKDFELNEKRLQQSSKIRPVYLSPEILLPTFDEGTVIIDAIFGSGLSKPVKGFIADIIAHINKAHRQVVAVDIPSGLFCDDNTNNNGAIVKADITLSFQFPKKSFFLPFSGPYAGKWHILPIGLHSSFIENEPTKDFFTDLHFIKSIKKGRPIFSHKNTYGHVLLMAGAYGKIGAASLSARASLKSGAGLVTVYLPKCGYNIIQTSVPEAMSITDKDNNKITAIPDLQKFNAIAMGPGIGTHTKTAAALKTLLTSVSVPLVLDADALNILSAHKDICKLLPPHTILTPHFKEFERLTGKTFNNDAERIKNLRSFSKKHKCIVVLKGAHTCVCTPDGDCFYNTTGNSGLATAGSGDVLTGMIAGFLAQGYKPLEAALCAVYLHGRAADIAVSLNETAETFMASDIIKNLGKAFKL